MKTLSAVPVLIILSIFLALEASGADTATGRAVSLKALESRIKAGESPEAMNLCGITWISGYMIDKKAQDIILFGTADPSYPPLYLEDFVVALRHARLAYAERKGDTYIYSPPACSIDPTTEVLGQLQEIGRKLGSASDVDQARTAMKQWEQIGSRPQNVRVLGVPADTRFARVMVEADYLMKRLADGSAEISLPGLQSLADMAEKEPNSSLNSMNRFWFFPGEVTFHESRGTLALKDCEVKLLTEQEYLSTDGGRSGTGRASPNAKRFAESFTTNYRNIAAVCPIYRELESLFRFAALAEIMKQRKAITEAGIDLHYLLSKFPISKTPVSPTLPGVTRVMESSETKETENGRTTSYRFQVSCGGVNIDVQPRHVTSPAEEAQLEQIRKKMLESRKSPTSLYWDFPLDD